VKGHAKEKRKECLGVVTRTGGKQYVEGVKGHFLALGHIKFRDASTSMMMDLEKNAMEQ
jgi:hypothetical protein